MNSNIAPPIFVSLARYARKALHETIRPNELSQSPQSLLALVGLGESLVVMRVDEGQHVADHRV